MGVGCRILSHLQEIPRRQTFMVEITFHPSRIKRAQNILASTPDETALKITIGESALPRTTGSGKTVPKIESKKPNANLGQNSNRSSWKKKKRLSKETLPTIEVQGI